MTDFSVTPESLRGAAAALAAESRHLEQVLGDLGQRVQALESNWDGAARQAYSRAQRDWTAALDDMTSILGRIAQSTEEMAEGYVTDDRQSAGRFTHQG